MASFNSRQPSLEQVFLTQTTTTPERATGGPATLAITFWVITSHNLPIKKRKWEHKGRFSSMSLREMEEQIALPSGPGTKDLLLMIQTPIETFSLRVPKGREDHFAECKAAFTEAIGECIKKAQNGGRVRVKVEVSETEDGEAAASSEKKEIEELCSNW
ncbi:hypothetical protein ACHAQA_007856 [Verticillium albo-atrum]